jgi:hypothetical protein
MALAMVGAGPASADSIVNVAMLGAGSGRVADTNTRGGIDCPGQCSVDYARAFELRDRLTLSASPSNLSVFKGWGGACSGTEPTCEIAAFYDSTKAVTARFEPLPLFGISGLSVSVAGAGGGTVTGPGVACPGDCSQSYLNSAAVALTATPAAGSTFAGWSGACSGAALSCNLTMSASKSVTATFSADPAQPDGPLSSSPLTGAPGNRGALGQSGRCTVLGTANSDVLTGTPGRDVICGLGGRDRIFGLGGNDVIRGGGGNDTVKAGPGRDRVFGNAGNDGLYGQGGADRLDGGRGRDRIVGGPGKDQAKIDKRDFRLRSVEKASRR